MLVRFANRTDLDFTNIADLQPTQQFDSLAENFDGQIEYSTKYCLVHFVLTAVHRVNKFQNVDCLAFYFQGGGDWLQIDYLGLKGLGTQVGNF